MPIIEYPYQLDPNNLEIFPEEIWRDPFVVYHGTSEYHSNNIENNGIEIGRSPFDINSANDLYNLLLNPNVSPFDIPRGYGGLNCARGLNSYLFGIQNNQIRLSFSNLSYSCVRYASGPLKGGQSLNHINEAQQIINAAISTTPGLINCVSQSILDLYTNVQAIQNSRGVVYAIKLPESLDGIEMGTGVVHSVLSIPRDSIVGKIVIPQNLNIADIDFNEIAQKHQSKLFKSHNSLGNLISKKNYPEDNEDD